MAEGLRMTKHGMRPGRGASPFAVAFLRGCMAVLALFACAWGNHHNAWRPNHIHFSVFGHSFVSRLVTQMYFPGDYLFPFDPIFNSVTDEKARMRMVSTFDLEATIPDWALAFRFDIVLRGREATPLDNDEH